MFLTKFFKNRLTIPQATELFEEIKSQTHPDIADLKRLVETHYGQADIPLKNCMIGSNIANHLMAMTE